MGWGGAGARGSSSPLTQHQGCVTSVKQAHPPETRADAAGAEPGLSTAGRADAARPAGVGLPPDPVWACVPVWLLLASEARGPDTHGQLPVHVPVRGQGLKLVFRTY